ncbi:MAG: hypothetical protein J0H01_16655 [Rhizobiales bacterium]|nr:hypothetical protein [Hyphomicrobiales bacterium]
MKLAILGFLWVAPLAFAVPVAARDASGVAGTSTRRLVAEAGPSEYIRQHAARPRRARQVAPHETHSPQRPATGTRPPVDDRPDIPSGGGGGSY